VKAGSFARFFFDDLSEYRLARSLVVRGIGLVYLIAILSWWSQATLLVGPNGLVPMQDLLSFLRDRFAVTGQNPVFSLPTIFWFTGPSDAAIHILCFVGCIFSVMVILGFYPGPFLLGAWAAYLSLVNTGDVFMSFQWDVLLLEAGFLTLFLTPWARRLPWRRPPALTPVNRVGVFLFWVVVAKLIFQSGWVKLAWATGAHPEWWPDRTALTFHYMTQPLPTWTAWWMYQLPVWFHKLSIWPMYVVELLFPFLILFGKKLRLIAALGFTGLMTLILLTGNYTYFNWLTIVISVALIADRFWPDRLLGWLRIERSKATTSVVTKRDQVWVLLVSPLIVLLVLLNVQTIASNFHQAPIPLLKSDLTPVWLDRLADKVRPFHLVSGYGLFRTMTTTRPEIILEGSSDGISWIAYDFKWKVDELDARPRFVAPHQPRVAWQWWFAALEGRFDPRSRNSRWFQSLLGKLLAGDKSVEALFERNPFPDKPPKYLRARLYRYEFTSITERKKTGDWWRRVAIGEYLPVVSKR